MKTFVHWNIDPEIINIFGVSLRYYGVLFVTGLMLSIVTLKWIFKREGIDLLKLDQLTVYGVIGILAGARLGHCLFYEPAYYLDHPLEMLLPIQASQDGGYKFTGYQGLASHGGGLGLLIALWFYSRRSKESMLRTLDMIAIVAPLAGCFIRLANLVNSEIVGVPTNVPWAFIFESKDAVPRHPAQLYEAVAYLFFFMVLWYLYKIGKASLQTGFFLGLSISLIFIARFFIEFLKENQVAFEDQMILNLGQWLSIPFIIGGIAIMLYGKGSRPNSELRSPEDVGSSQDVSV